MRMNVPIGKITRVDNLTLFNNTLGQCLATENNTDWQGYWQGNHRKEERLVM